MAAFNRSRDPPVDSELTQPTGTELFTGEETGVGTIKCIRTTDTELLSHTDAATRSSAHDHTSDANYKVNDRTHFTCFLTCAGLTPDECPLASASI